MSSIQASSGKPSRATRKKLVVVGDGTCGKTCLLIAYTKNEFPETYIPTIFESYVADIKANEETTVQMALWDTAGQEDYELLRPLSYPNTDVLLVCFAVNNRDSFENVSQKWLPEVKHHCPNTPFLLVGTKVDLRTASGTPSPRSEGSHSSIVQFNEGVKMAKLLGAYGYVECSAKTRLGVGDVFYQAVLASLGERKKKPPVCSLV